MLGAEVGGLPAEVGGAARIFFERNLEWLKIALTESGLAAADAKAHATHILAALEGAMILSKSLDDERAFESVARGLAGLADL